jgi:hypothetical protein
VLRRFSFQAIAPTLAECPLIFRTSLQRLTSYTIAAPYELPTDRNRLSDVQETDVARFMSKSQSFDTDPLDAFQRYTAEPRHTASMSMLDQSTRFK